MQSEAATEVDIASSKEMDQGYITVDFDGLQTYMDDHSSEVLVVNFWATWCKPCIKELPAFEKLQDVYADKNVSVVLVSLDFPDQLELLRDFIAEKDLKSEVVYLDDSNANEWIPKVNEHWSGAIPATFIKTDKNKKFYERSFTYQELENEITPLIN